MIAARAPRARSDEPRVLIVHPSGILQHATRRALIDFAAAGDIVVANDAFTAPASLAAIHVRTGERVELRLAATRSTDMRDLTRCVAVVFGAGDFHVRTEDRGPPPRLAAGDRLLIGTFNAVIERTLDHPRLVALRFEATSSDVWSMLAHHGRPIQYAHVDRPLALWDTWNVTAASPVAFEPPSAGFVLDWELLQGLRERGVAFATLSHAAGISSTGDAALDTRLPLDEPYLIPAATAAVIERSRARGGRVIAIGTTVVRALEHAGAVTGAVKAGPNVATQRIDGATRLRVVDVIVSGTHDPGTSHYELLRAFASDDVLQSMSDALEDHGYRTHEFGDFIVLPAAAKMQPSSSIPTHAPRSVPRARCHASLLPA